MAAASWFVAGSLSANAQCTAPNALTIPAQYLNPGFTGDGNFNAIVFGDYNSGDGGTDGRLAVGGNFTLNASTAGYQVGVTGLSPAGEDNFIVNGLLTNTTGKNIKVRGNFHYGALQSNSPLPVHEPGEGVNVNQSGRIKFAELKVHYTTASDDYVTSGGAVPINSDSDLVLTGDNTVKNYVFNVTVSTSAISSIQFVNIPAGSGILINILNNSIIMSSSETSFPMVDTHRPKTLFNFPNATSILLSSFTVEGGILAPQADLYVQTGEINGPAVIGGNISQSTGFSFNSACLSYPLPVKLLGFDAKIEGRQANLRWETSSEINTESFIVERRQGKQWQPIGALTAKGQKDINTVYHFTDPQPLHGENLYRLKMTDQDNSFSYSKMVSLVFKESDGIIAFPNPVAEQLSFSHIDWEKVSYIQISDKSGNTIPFQLNSENKLNVRGWKTGMYTIRVSSKDGSVSNQKIIKY
jgi:choice-of-anchor A domain-containing protein